jgi:hypothetical protein
VEAGVQAIAELLPRVNDVRRTRLSADKIVLGTNCGGSDGNSGVTANPALGVASDLLVAQGGTSVLAETPEIYGAEHLLTRRAISRAVGEKLVERIKWWEWYTGIFGAEINNNPSPGNKDGGLTTIYEKSLGAIAKGGIDPAVEAQLFTMMQNDALQQILMTASRERSERSVLRIIVDGLAAQPHVALARIWLTGPGDICATCRMRPECPDQSRCLHLEASSGRSLAEPSAYWTRIDGDFRRFPVGVRKVGQIAATGIPLFVANTAEQSEWIARPEWATREHIRSFAGQPLVFGSETLVVIAVFSRVELTEIDIRWLRLFADQAAITIVNARAFEEIERLKGRLELENEYLREEISQSQACSDIVGSSPVLKKVLEQIDLVAGTNANVLILGESGTGKELVARAIHQRSRRRDRPLVKVNCASIPKELFESEFFGHAKGAFTGALRDRIGRFQLADGGTIFLDEVGEIPLDLQSKLLRVLQEREFERVGEETSRRVDVRIIAATNRDLEAESRAGRFREDLYYRLAVAHVVVPPLRERREDVAILAERFWRDLAARVSSRAVLAFVEGGRLLVRV